MHYEQLVAFRYNKSARQLYQLANSSEATFSYPAQFLLCMNAEVSTKTLVNSSVVVDPGGFYTFNLVLSPKPKMAASQYLLGVVVFV